MWDEGARRPTAKAGPINVVRGLFIPAKNLKTFTAED
jgi:hypothetical protein